VNIRVRHIAAITFFGLLAGLFLSLLVSTRSLF